ncbi:TPA: hypothetical protein ACIVB1_001817 [Salmonella enterica subsp. diarizonae serovar 61:l,v:z35]
MVSQATAQEYIFLPSAGFLYCVAEITISADPAFMISGSGSAGSGAYFVDNVSGATTERRPGRPCDGTPRIRRNAVLARADPTAVARASVERPTASSWLIKLMIIICSCFTEREKNTKKECRNNLPKNDVQIGNQLKPRDEDFYEIPHS